MKPFITSARVLLFFTLLCGVACPLLITAVAQAGFARQANGSLVVVDGKARGSELIGQQFDKPEYFWGRLSATTPPYNAAASSGSNLGPTNPALLEEIAGRVKALRDADPANNQPVPTDLATSSASGLDPHISVAAAEYQVARVARARHLSEDQVRAVVKESSSTRQLGVLGEPVVNVLRLNLALDRLNATSKKN
ncbi:MAG: potassium-transporting ATPase subunit KdpC [Armatimonadetes bacterium]|nr:potassium-transporting ATPase subunit KdpC [Armatimonadota bacterium]